MPQLTEQQIEQYRRDGFLIVEKLIEPEQAQALLERYEAIFERAEYDKWARTWPASAAGKAHGS